MLSRVKASCFAAAAMLVVSGSVMSPTTAAPAQGNIQLAMSVQRDGIRGNEMRRSSTREMNISRTSTRDMRSNRVAARHISRVDRARINQTVVHRNVIVRRDIVRRHVVIRDHRRVVIVDHGRRSFAAVGIVVLGPQVVYRPGWCRGLHRGHHWAPRIGWHSGRHFGLFRC